MSEDRKTCFVIMPFSKTTDEHTAEYWTKHYENFLKPLIEENPNLEARRSKELRGDILNEIITDLVTSPIVVANLTDKNANVFWELGIRQSFKHGTITIAEEVTNLPFDVAGKGTLKYYPMDITLNEKFRRDFKEALEDCLQNPNRPDSQVLETLSGRGTMFEIFHQDEAIRRLDALISECNRNSSVLGKAVETARYNKENPDNGKFPTSRFRGSAADLLITNRYVDEDQSFFKLAEKYIDQINKLNDQLNLWEHSPELTEQWFISIHENSNKLIMDFKNKVETARDKVRKLL